ncbi:MAG: DUF4153 domain-containing protein [Sandaracinaceae bacterium]
MPPPPFVASAQSPYRSTEATPVAAPSSVRRFGLRELAAVALGVVLVDVTLLDADGLRAGGVGLAALFASMLVLVYCSARARRLSASAGVVALGLVLVAVRCAFEPTPLTFMSGAFLVLAWGVVLRRPRALVLRVGLTWLRSVPAWPGRVKAAGTRAADVVTGLSGGRRHLLPVLIPAMLTLCFVGLFSLANPVVANLVGALWSWVMAGVVLPGVARVFTWLLAAAALVTLVRPSVALVKAHDELDTETEFVSRVRELVARNTLLASNLLFLSYNALEASYLFGGRVPEGMTTQEYAHQGAFWLTVTLALLTVVVSGLFRGALAHRPEGRLPRRLAMLWIAQGLVIGAGTYWRIGIHIQHSGLSNLRIVGVLGTSLVILGALLVGAKLHWRRSFFWLFSRQMSAFAVVAVGFAVFPTHTLSAAVNVRRIQSGEAGPLVHMRAQSQEPESAVLLLPLLHHENATVRRGVAVLLRRSRTRLVEDVYDRHSAREFDLLSPWALRQITDARPRIDALLQGADEDAALSVMRALAVAPSPTATMSEPSAGM